MVPYALVIFFAMTPYNGTAQDTQYTKMFVEYESLLACEAAAEDLTNFKVETPIGTLEVATDCFPMG